MRPRFSPFHIDSPRLKYDQSWDEAVVRKPSG